jgi:hypothetical protein
MPNEVVGIDIVAKLDGFRKEMATLPTTAGSEGKKLAVQLSREIKAAEKAAKDAAKAAKESSAALAATGRATEQAIGRGKESISQLGAALTVVSPEIGGLVQQAGAMTGAVKAGAAAASGMGISLGLLAAAAVPVAAALGALLVWHQKLVREQELSAALTETQKQANKSLEPMVRALEDATIDLAVATGQYTAEQGAAIEAANKAQRAVLDLAAAQDDQRKALRGTIESNEAWKTSISDARDVLKYTPLGLVTEAVGLNQVLEDGIDYVAGFSDNIENANAQLGALDGAVAKAAETQKKLKKTTEDLTKAKGGNSRATRDEKEATDDLWRSYELLSETLGNQARSAGEAGTLILSQIDEWVAASEQLATIAETAATDLLTPIEKETAEREKQLALIADLAEKTGDYTTAQIASHNIIAKADEEAAARAVELRKRQQDAMADVLSQAFGGMADLAEFAAERLEGTGPAAVAAFEAWKSFSYAAALVQGYQAAVSAYAATVVIPVVGPVLAPIAAATAIAATGLQVAKIAATEMPTRHSGGMAPDEMATVLTRQEGVLTSMGTNAAGGEAGVDALNRGFGGSQVIYVEQVYKHRAYGKMRADYDKAHPPKPAKPPGMRF